MNSCGLVSRIWSRSREVAGWLCARKRPSKQRVAGGQLEPRLTVTADALLQVLDLGHGRVLAAGAQEVAEIVESNTAVAALVEQRESLLVVG